MRNFKLFFSLILLSVTSFAQPLPQEVPGAYNGGSNNPDYNGVLYYTTLDNNLIFSSNNELWVTDGSVTGTQFLKAFRFSTKPYGLKEWNGVVYFIADDSVHGYELWSTDGTTGGTNLIKDIYPGLWSGFDSLFLGTNGFFQELNGNLWFPAKDDVHGRELWSTDGTPGGTNLFNDMCPGSCSGVSSQRDLLSVNNRLYFFGNAPVTFGGMYMTDGTINGTICLMDSMYQVTKLIPFGNKILFTETVDASIFNTSISDGTVAGTFRLMNDTANWIDHAEMNGKLYFVAGHYTGSFSLMETDGSINGTHVVATENFSPIQGNTYNFVPKSFLTRFNNKLLFSAGSTSNSSGVELYTSDGTSAGTALFKDLIPGQYSSNPYNLTLFNNEVYFQAWDSNRVNIWHTDGTLNGTNMIAIPAADALPSNHSFFNRWLVIRQLMPVGNSLYFYAKYFTTAGFRLYKLDVFPTGIKQEPTFTSIDIYPNPSQGYINVDATNATNISIYNITGSLVCNEQLNAKETTHKTEIQQLSPGTYTVTTLLSDGSIRSGKFVKQ